jgi:DHA2 family multidrug resistance protein-like MFS transporter
LRITVNLVACGIGFGLFQTPNNTTIVSTAPPERGGAASGMIGVARLMGQCFGAALVALLFKVIPDQALSIKTCQYIAVGFAVVAAALSISRVKYAVPGKK